MSVRNELAAMFTRSLRGLQLAYCAHLAAQVGDEASAAELYADAAHTFGRLAEQAAAFDRRGVDHTDAALVRYEHLLRLREADDLIMDGRPAAEVAAIADLSISSVKNRPAWRQYGKRQRPVVDEQAVRAAIAAGGTPTEIAARAGYSRQTITSRMSR